MSHFATVARFCGSALLLGILTSIGPPLHGQGPAPPANATTWDRLADAPPGSRVKLTLIGGSVAKGRIVFVKPDAVVLDDLQTGSTGIATTAGAWAGDRLTLPRTEIASVEVLSRPRPEGGPRAGSFEQLGAIVGPGDKVAVTDANGTQFSGTIAGLSQSTLSLRIRGETLDLREGDVTTIKQRRADSLANGAKWGLGVGAASGMLACGTCHVGPGLMMAGVWGGIGAGIGVGLDALIGSDFVVFQRRDSTRRVAIAPQLAKSHKGIRVTVGF